MGMVSDIAWNVRLSDSGCRGGRGFPPEPLQNGGSGRLGARAEPFGLKLLGDRVRSLVDGIEGRLGGDRLGLTFAQALQGRLGVGQRGGLRRGRPRMPGLEASDGLGRLGDSTTALERGQASAGVGDRMSEFLTSAAKTARASRTALRSASSAARA